MVTMEMGSPWMWALVCVLLGWLCDGQVAAATGRAAPDVNCTMTISSQEGSLCLWLVKNLKTWEEADADCALHGGYLVAVTSQEVNDVIKSLMENNSISHLWVGLREDGSTWRWLSNQKPLFHQGCFLEDTEDRELDVKFLLPNNSYAGCSEKCSGTGRRFAGLQSPTECWCGDRVGRYGYGDCNLLCGDRMQVCGGNRDGKVASYVNLPGGEYSHWERGQPNNHQLYQTCASMDNYNEYQWNDLKCTERSGLICEYNMTEDACLANQFLYNETWGCYYVSDVRMTFFEGLMFCDTKGGHLLEISSEEKQDHFEKEVLQKGTYSTRAFFIGLSRAQWVWTTGKQLIYSSWGPEWPNGKDQNCVVIDRRGKWNDVTCSVPYNYVCQRGNTPRVPTTPTTPPTTTRNTRPTTTTPRPTRRPCGITCQNANAAYEQEKRDRMHTVYYYLIGGGTILTLIIICCTIGTVYCLKTHYMKKKEKKFDYFFGVDVSREEDKTEFKPSKSQEDGTSELTHTAPTLPIPDVVITTDISDKLTPLDQSKLSEQTDSLQPTSNGIDNSGFEDEENLRKSGTQADEFASQSLDAHQDSSIDVPPAPDLPGLSSEAAVHIDDVYDTTSTPPMGQMDERQLIEGGTDMSTYDYEKPDASQMMY